MSQPIFDYDRALTTADGDTELVTELVELFMEKCPEMLADLERAVESDDSEALVLAAHTLKGSAASVGALAIAETAEFLEKSGNARDMAPTQNSYNLIEAEVRDFEREVSELSRKVLK